MTTVALSLVRTSSMFGYFTYFICLGNYLYIWFYYPVIYFFASNLILKITEVSFHVYARLNYLDDVSLEASKYIRSGYNSKGLCRD